MNKKKILVLAMALSMVAILAIGGTIAYFTDTDDATNTFTMGGIDITLNEVFDKDNAKLIPAKVNAINKDVTITLEEGSVDSYVWYEWFIPTALDSTDGSTGTNNIVHVNSLGRTWDNYRKDEKYWTADQTEALDVEMTWDHDPEIEMKLEVGPQGYFDQVEIDGIKYNKYVALYHGVLSAGETTTQAMDQVWLDDKVDTNEKGEYTYNGQVINYDFTKGINIIVNAYGIQADLADFDKDGDVDVYDAYQTYNKK